MSDVSPRAERRLEAALSLDGLTVRLHLLGEELVITVDDPTASVDTLSLVDAHSRETVLQRTGLAARTRTRAVVTRMIDALHDAGSISARAVVARMRPGGDIDSEAVHALSRAVALSGRAEMWGWTMTRVRDSFQLLRLEDPDAIIPPFLAAGFADLTGRHGFEREHFEAMTASWRAVVGDLPAEADSSTVPPMLRAG